MDNVGARIRLLLFTANRGVGGMEEHIDLIARHMDRSRFEVFAVCPDVEEAQPFREKLQRHCDHFAAIPLNPDRSEDGLDLGYLYRTVRRWRIQVAHMHNGYFYGNKWPYAMLRLAGVRRVYVTEHTPPDSNLWRSVRWVHNAMTWTLDGVVCISQKHKRLRSRFFYTPENRTHVIENGIDLGDFGPIPEQQISAMRNAFGIPADAMVIGSLVRLVSDKGLSYLIDAMPMILDACPNTHLLLVGDGPLLGELKARSARLGVDHSVHFAGFHRSAQPFLGLLDVFVLPVPYGTMSIALLEAMAMRRASVISFGGQGEAVIHGQTGLEAEPHSSISLAEHVIALLQDSALRERIGNAARAHVEQSFSAERTARRLELVYAGSAR